MRSNARESLNVETLNSVERLNSVDRLSSAELWWALAICAGVSALYVVLVRVAGADPRSSGLLGHGFGIIGFILMLMTETLYSLRKRSRYAHWGRMANWLRFHIVTGIVGPYMVLLHTAWRYNGLAGLVMLMTGIVVISGFVGRYIYTRVPRNADGLALEASELQTQIEASRLALASGTFGGGRELRRMVARQKRLERQAASLVTARQTLGMWTSVHIPLSVALFIAAFIHIAAALYYATLLR